MRGAWMAGAIALTVLSACAAREATPPSPAEAAAALKAEGPSFAVLHATGGSAAAHPLRVRETGLLGLTLGMKPEAVKGVLGKADKTQTSAEGIWWIYESGDPRLKAGGDVRLLFNGESLVQIRAWAPSRAETATMIRPLDPAVRITRKYGAPAQAIAWGAGGAEAWIYPAADVAYVVTAPDERQRRQVAAIIVGL